MSVHILWSDFCARPLFKGKMIQVSVIVEDARDVRGRMRKRAASALPAHHIHTHTLAQLAMGTKMSKCQPLVLQR